MTGGGSLFTVASSTGQISLTAAFECAPRRNHALTLSVTDGKAADGSADPASDASISVNVIVTDADDPGSVALSTTSPQAGQQISATLTEPDACVTNQSWTWARSPDKAAWTDIAGANAAAYVPSDADRGAWLRATVTYDDVHGAGKSASSIAANKVPASTTGPDGNDNSNGNDNGNSNSNSGGGGGGGGGGREASTATVIIANGWSPADIGVAAALSARTEDSAVVYTLGNRLPVSVADLLEDDAPARVIIVGGRAAISNGVRNAAERASGGASFERVSGSTRSDTSARVARRVLAAAPRDAATLMLVNGWSPADIGVAAALSARTPGSAVLYTEAKSLPFEVHAVLVDHSPARVVIVGGPAAVTVDVEAAVRDAVPTAFIERISGADRFSTAATVADRIVGSDDETVVIIANGHSPSDIGIAAALSAHTADAAVAYVTARELTAPTAELIEVSRPQRVIIIGGPAVATPSLEAALRLLVPQARIPRYEGATRVHTAVIIARLILGRP